VGPDYKQEVFRHPTARNWSSARPRGLAYGRRTDDRQDGVFLFWAGGSRGAHRVHTVFEVDRDGGPSPLRGCGKYFRTQGSALQVTPSMLEATHPQATWSQGG